MENSVMLNAVCNEPVSLKVLEEPFYRKGFSPFVNKETGTWWEYDDDKKGFFDTGIIAQGRDGDTVDVRVDGKSIVQDGVANIPIATNNTPGLVKPLSAIYGLMLDEKGNLFLSGVDKSVIDERTNNYKGITAKFLDYAVKAAMCDGKGKPWTAEEQAAARERMGIGDYELIEEITIDTDDITEIVRDIDLNGNPYNFAKLWVICECPKQSQNVSVEFGNGTQVAPLVGIANSSGNCSTNVEIDCTSGYLVYRYVSRVIYNRIAQPVYQTRPVLQMLASTRLVIQNPSTGNIPNGAKFKIYGVRK